MQAREVGVVEVGVVSGFDGLLDDAALFPPGNAPMADAVPAHREYRAAWYDRLVGPFLVAVPRWSELRARLGASGVLDLGLIAPADRLVEPLAQALAEPRVALTAVEVAPSELPPRQAIGVLDELVPDRVAVAVEVPRGSLRPAFLDALAGTRYRAKLRTGGTVAEAFPGEAELGLAIADCRDRALPFKCTAGLHHAVRHTAADTGFEHHGYLNILLAAEAAARGAPAAELAELLAERAEVTVVGAVAALPAQRLRAARELFGSFGTCSIAEPVEDLVTLGLLSPPTPPLESVR